MIFVPILLVAGWSDSCTACSFVQKSLRLHLIKQCCIIMFLSPAHFCTGVFDEHMSLWHDVCHSTHRLQTTALLSQRWQWTCACQPRASAERWGRSLSTLSRTTQDGCFPSSSSISHPMIHFTDTWVIIGVCSSPLGTELQGGGGCLAGNAKTGQEVRECKTKRQE